MSRIPIFHIASMPRSGETLVLRQLAAHPQIRCVHNISSRDTRDEVELFRFLKTFPGTEISSSHRKVQHLKLTSGDRILLKQGVWEHPSLFEGLVLARNPLAIFASLWVYDGQEENTHTPVTWSKNLQRSKRWLMDIEPSLLYGFHDLSPTEQFSLLYNRRMGALLETGLPIIHYERLVSDPEDTLRRICNILGVPFDDALLKAHEGYAKGELGHGRNDLSRPIDTTSIDKWRTILSESQIAEILEKTRTVAAGYGYADGKLHEPSTTKAGDGSPRRTARKPEWKDTLWLGMIKPVLRKAKSRVMEKVSPQERAALWSKESLQEPFRSLPFAQEAMRKLIEDFHFETVLDVGSGGGRHAECFRSFGKKVTAVDFGRSPYFEKRDQDYDYIQGDFMTVEIPGQFDCVWASHVLEHQPNPGDFIQRCLSYLKEDGIFAVTVPPLKHEIVGGHLSLWNAGLLLYNLVFNGLDCRHAHVRTYGYNVSVLVQKKTRPTIDLAYDKGDIAKLSAFFPGNPKEGFHGIIDSLNW